MSHCDFITVKGVLGTLPDTVQNNVLIGNNITVPNALSGLLLLYHTAGESWIQIVKRGLINFL